MAERMKSCTICHGTEDKAGRDAYYPRIAGKPKGYLFNQLRNFRDGRRYYRPMALLLATASDQYLLEMADYFATLKQPYPAPERIALSPGETRLAEKLIHQGDAARKIPACVECHGKQKQHDHKAVPNEAFGRNCRNDATQRAYRGRTENVKRDQWDGRHANRQTDSQLPMKRLRQE